MIIVKVYGGLAGQMLQYSIGKFLSKKHETSLYLDLSWYENNSNSQYPREFKLDKLKTSFRVYKNSYFNRLIASRRIKGLNPFYLELVREKDFSKFDPQFLNTPNNCILDGYFFSYKYFDSILNDLRKDFIPRNEMTGENALMLRSIESSNSVSVHFRRGDYQLTDFHGLLGKEYYDKALSIISERVDSPKLFVFSDEPQWVKENISFPFPSVVVDINKDEFNYFDIALMRSCKHNIIANSGFSWWAALLNENQNKIVIAPKKWVNSESNPEFENILANWIKV